MRLLRRFTLSDSSIRKTIMHFNRAISRVLWDCMFRSPVADVERPQNSRRPPVRQHRCGIPERTGPLQVLNGRNVLVLADDENLRYSARDVGLKVSYQTLAERLQRSAKSCALHAFFSHEPGDYRRIDYLASRGWKPHGYLISTVKTHRGTETFANADNLILFVAGQLVDRFKPDVVVIASGDGTLVCDIASFLNACSYRPKVATLSLPNSTSRRLSAAQNEHIKANIEVGHDCLKRGHSNHARNVRHRVAAKAVSRF